MTKEYKRGVEDCIKIIEERGREIGGAIQPSITIKKIRKELLNEEV